MCVFPAVNVANVHAFQPAVGAGMTGSSSNMQMNRLPESKDFVGNTAQPVPTTAPIFSTHGGEEAHFYRRDVKKESQPDFKSDGSELADFWSDSASDSSDPRRVEPRLSMKQKPKRPNNKKVNEALESSESFEFEAASSLQNKRAKKSS